MGSRFREQLTHWTDPSVFTQPDQWKGFLWKRSPRTSTIKGGLTLKDLKPDTFENNEKSKLSFRQWSDEFSSGVERIDQDFETMLRLAAQMQEWDQDKFIAAAQQDCRLGAEIRRV